jgi:betaine lipid synthase
MPFSQLVELVRDPLIRVGLSGAIIIVFLAAVFTFAFTDTQKSNGILAQVGAYGRFVYACVLKPHTGDNTGNQQDALESFYKAQAAVYDATRARLLHGREDMLGLVASQLKDRTWEDRKPLWVDVGILLVRTLGGVANPELPDWWGYWLEH